VVQGGVLLASKGRAGLAGLLHLRYAERHCSGQQYRQRDESGELHHGCRVFSDAVGDILIGPELPYERGRLPKLRVVLRHI